MIEWSFLWLIIPGAIVYIFSAGFTAGKIRRWQQDRYGELDDFFCQSILHWERVLGSALWPVTATCVYLVAPPTRGLIKIGKAGYRLGLDERRPTLTRGTSVPGTSLVHRE